MAETLAIAASVASIASAGASVIGGMSGSNQSESEASLFRSEAEGFRDEAAQFADERETARVNALIEETNRRRELSEVMATQEAIRAGRGLELSTGTSEAIRAGDTQEMQRDVDLIRLNAFNKQRQFRLAEAGAFRSASGSLTRAGTSLSRGRSSMLSSFATAGGTLLSGAQSAYKAFSAPTPRK